MGDLNRPETLERHLRGVEAVFLLSGYDGMGETLALIRRAGVERVVLLSSSAAPGGDLGNAVARYHILSEEAVRRSGLPWTFLQPNSFMSNTFGWIPQLREGAVVSAPFANVPVATIDPDDVAAVAAAALTSNEHEGRAYRLVAPRLCSQRTASPRSAGCWTATSTSSRCRTRRLARSFAEPCRCST